MPKGGSTAVRLVYQVDYNASLNSAKSALNAIEALARKPIKVRLEVDKNATAAATKAVQSVTKATTTAQKDLSNQINKLNSAAQKNINASTKATAGQGTVQSAKAELKQLETAYSTTLSKITQTKAELQSAMSTLTQSQASGASQDVLEQQVKNVENLNLKLKELNATASAQKSAKNSLMKQLGLSASAEDLVSLDKVKAAINDIDKFMASNKRIAGTTQATELANMRNELDGVVQASKAAGDGIANMSKGKFGEMTSQISKAKTELQAMGKTGQGFFEKAGQMIGKFAGWSLITTGLMSAQNGLRTIVTDVTAIDTAMTELRKVTDETESTYSKFLDTASTRAVKLGATIADTVTATADFARLGYNISEASQLADAATVYKNVGDGIADISEASESIISTMQAFGIEAQNSMSIVDEFNEVGNRFAISSKGIGEALVRSASSLEAGGNTLEQSIGLITSANTIVQD